MSKNAIPKNSHEQEAFVFFCELHAFEEKLDFRY